MNNQFKVHRIIIKDEETGKTYIVETVRTAREIAGSIEETENEAISDLEVYGQER